MRSSAASSCRAPTAAAPCTDFVEVADRGVITTFCIVNIPVIGRDLDIPYVAASVALDGADISIFALIQECKPEEVRMGMRVEAVWKPDGERQGCCRHETMRPDQGKRPLVGPWFARSPTFRSVAPES